MVHSWIVNSTTPSVAESIVSIENEIDVWNDLKDRYMRGNQSHIVRLQHDIENVKQGNQTITEYITELCCDISLNCIVMKFQIFN